ncbi:MAG: hypothetical protein MJE68_06470, partial [Proteobacteria bacterium]|nr:hypothetical protein [Pseudomonadota bacterium]
PRWTMKHVVNDGQAYDLKPRNPIETELNPINGSTRNVEYATAPKGYGYDRDRVHRSPWHASLKCKDDDGYPLPPLRKGLGWKAKRYVKRTAGQNLIKIMIVMRKLTHRIPHLNFPSARVHHWILHSKLVTCCPI